MWKSGNASLNNEGVKEEMTEKIRMLFFSRSVVSDSLQPHELQPVSHHLPRFVQVHVRCIGDAIQLSHPLMPSSPANIGNLISGSTAFSKPSLENWKFLVHVMLKPSMQDFKHDLISMGDDCNIQIVWTFFSTTLLRNWDEDWPFPVPCPLLGFPDLWTYWECSTLIASYFRVLENSIGISLHTLALFTTVLPKAHMTSYSWSSGSGWLTTPLWLTGSLRSFFV